MTDYSRVFTLEVDGKPILTFEATRLREAQPLCKEHWLREDPTSLTSNGVSLLNANAKLSVRLATLAETDVFRQAVAATEQSDDMMLAYLVELDG